MIFARHHPFDSENSLSNNREGIKLTEIILCYNSDQHHFVTLSLKYLNQNGICQKLESVLSDWISFKEFSDVSLKSILKSSILIFYVTILLHQPQFWSQQWQCLKYFSKKLQQEGDKAMLELKQKGLWMALQAADQGNANSNNMRHFRL